MEVLRLEILRCCKASFVGLHLLLSERFRLPVRVGNERRISMGIFENPYQRSVREVRGEKEWEAKILDRYPQYTAIYRAKWKCKNCGRRSVILADDMYGQRTELCTECGYSRSVPEPDPD